MYKKKTGHRSSYKSRNHILSENTFYLYRRRDTAPPIRDSGKLNALYDMYPPPHMTCILLLLDADYRVMEKDHTVMPV